MRWKRHFRQLLIGAAIISLTAAPVGAQTFSSGSTGADGAFSPTANTTLTPPANGVFNFTTVNIPAGVTVTIQKNAANTPATMLATEPPRKLPSSPRHSPRSLPASARIRERPEVLPSR